MLSSYFKIALRNLARNKSYTAINIAGLAVGITVCMMIFMVIQFHTGYDGFHAKKDRICRVLTEYHHDKTATVSYGKEVPFPLPAALKTSFPQFEQVATVFASHDDQLLITEQGGIAPKTFKEKQGVFFVEPSFFNIFDFPLLTGSYASLEEPNNVLLTQTTAEKYFGSWQAAMGKIIQLEVGGYLFEHGSETLKISGILADIPENSDFQIKLAVSYGTGFTGSLMATSTDWEDRTNTNYGCYVLLPPNVAIDQVNQQLRAFSRKSVAPDNTDSHLLQPLSAVHYDTQSGNYSNKSISQELLNVLWLIAIFILLIACVNFINLSTAQAVNRAREVGIRKVLGSNVAQLRVKFLAETFIIVTGAVGLATVATFFTLPYLDQLLELPLRFDPAQNQEIALFLAATALGVTLLAGLYPSVILSGFNPVNALKSKFRSNPAGGLSLRRGLVVFQFVVAQALMIGTFIIVKQMDYFTTQPLGFDKEALVNIPFRLDSLRISRLDYLKNKLMAVNGVESVSFSSNTPAEGGNDIRSAFKFDHAAKDADFRAITKFVDAGYVPTYKLQLIAGRNLQPSSFTREFLINESMMKKLGYKQPEDILNKEISMWSNRIKCPIVGVLKDFNNRSLRNDLEPVLLTTNITMYSEIDVKMQTQNMSATLQSVKTVCEQTFPNFVYENRFLDEKIAGFYKQENQLSALFKIFAIIAVFLSCLGLYGLASFMAVQRIKEIGIRKVLGASVAGVTTMLTQDFLKLVVIAALMATPLAWYLMDQWLSDFAYRIDMQWWMFAGVGLTALLIALLTVGGLAVKAAWANPVKNLQSE